MDKRKTWRLGLWLWIGTGTERVCGKSRTQPGELRDVVVVVGRVHVEDVLELGDSHVEAGGTGKRERGKRGGGGMRDRIRSGDGGIGVVHPSIHPFIHPSIERSSDNRMGYVALTL
jgi:hypothetical protein